MKENIKLDFIISCNYELTHEEREIIFALSDKIKKDDVNFKLYSFEVNELISLLKLDDKNELLEITKGLMRKVFEIKTGEKIIQTSWISEVDFENEKVNLFINPVLKNYLAALKNSKLILMKNKYSNRIYELIRYFKRNNSSNSFEMTLAEFKRALQIENLYSHYANLKEKVLVPVKRELKKNADLYFDFKEIKENNKVVSLKFEICSKIKNEPIIIKKNSEDTAIFQIMRLTDNIFSKENCQDFLKESNKDMNLIKNAYEDYKILSRYGGVADANDFMIKQIQELYKNE